MNEQLSINLDPAEIQSFTNDIEDIILEASAKLLGGLVTRSKHEAYGIAAENFARIQHTLKALKSDLGSLLNTLDGDVPSSQVIDAISSMHGTTCALSKEATLFAATCNRKIAGMPSMNFFFRVLWRMARMVRNMPTLPPIAATVSKVDSRTRLPPRIARRLSNTVMQKAKKLTASR